MEFKNKQNEFIDVVFGKKEKFFLDSSIKHINHASYGAVSKFCWNEIDQMNLEVLKNPDQFMWHRVFENYWIRSVTAIAKYLKINIENIVLSENVTDGLNAAYKLVNFNSVSDVILVNDFSYTEMNNAIDFSLKYEKAYGDIPIIRPSMHYPLLNAKQIIDAFDSTCHEIVMVRKLRIRLAIIDHITSINGLLLPVKEICEVIRKWEQVWKENQNTCFTDENDYKTYIIIDGAHAFGQVKINLNDYDCDFYVTCLHKWFYSPWGCAFIYFKNAKMKNLQPQLSYNKYKIPFSNFAEPATRNESLRLVYNSYVDFFEGQLGGLENINDYAKKLQTIVIPMLVSSWESKIQQVDKELEAPFVKCIELPSSLQNLYTRDKLIDILRDKYKISTLFNVFNNKIFCRISFAVYNTIDDYCALNDAILDLVKINKN